MRSITKFVVGTLAGLAMLWVGWGVYVSRATERIPSETLDRFDGVELRRYPQTVLVETTAVDSGTAFGRLFRYITGANEGDQSLRMTAPVATRSEEIPMTAPVRTDSGEGSVTMAFYLPPEYPPERAPVPTDPEVRLVVEPPRTTAVRRFSWYATDDRVDRERTRLYAALEERGIERRGDAVVLQYNDPWTPPFMRTNEVAVAVDDTEGASR